MKKLIFAALLLVSTGALSAFTIKNDTASARKELATADARKELATADARKELATADAKNHAKSDRKELATAD